MSARGRNNMTLTDANKNQGSTDAGSEEFDQLPLKSAYAFGIEHGLEQEINEIRDKDIEWDRPYTSSLRRGFIAELFSKRGLLNDFKKAYWNNGNTARGEAKLRRYETIKRQYDDFITGRVGEGDLKESLEDLEAEQAFAAEADLRDFLANNLSVIEQGLRLYQDGTR